jgi:aldehyde dehydrogenase family 7 member A1
MVKAYANVKIGDPADSETLMGPLHNKKGVTEYLEGLEEIKKQGGEILCGGKLCENLGGNYVEPTIVAISHDAPIV